MFVWCRGGAQKRQQRKAYVGWRQQRHALFLRKLSRTMPHKERVLRFLHQPTSHADWVLHRPDGCDRP